MKNKAKVRSRNTTLIMFIAIFWILPTQESYCGNQDLPGGIDYQIKNCGNQDQVSCKYSSAYDKGPVRTPKPRGAFVDPRKGGEYWRCPVDFPRRTAYPVTDKRACATKNIAGEKLSPAEYLGKVNNPKPPGAFIDLYDPDTAESQQVFPTGGDGPHYWQCPSGYTRNITAVWATDACVFKGKACKDGLYPVRENANVEYCRKKNTCGGQNQRLCKLSENISPCKSGFVKQPLPKEQERYTICVTPAKAKCIETVLRDPTITVKYSWDGSSSRFTYYKCTSIP